jgi:hypothetical protein
MNTIIRFGSLCLLHSLLIVPAIGADSAPTELSVAPLDHVTYPAERPQWVADADRGAPYTVVDDNKLVIVSRLCETPQQCDDLVMIAAGVAADQYAIDLVDFGTGDCFYKFTDQELRDLITREYDGTATQGDMTVYERAIELTFTAEKRQEIVTASQNIEVNRRLRTVGGYFLFGLIALFGSTAAIGTASRLRGTCGHKI